MLQYPQPPQESSKGRAVITAAVEREWGRGYTHMYTHFDAILTQVDTQPWSSSKDDVDEDTCQSLNNIAMYLEKGGGSREGGGRGPVEHYATEDRCGGRVCGSGLTVAGSGDGTDEVWTV